MPNAQASLADLSAVVLQKHLDKNTKVRLSEEWDNEMLTQEQEEYAASDVWASLQIYKYLSKLSVPQPLPSDLQPGLQVLLYSVENTTVIARGQISLHANSTFYDSIRISPSRTVIDVSVVLVPATIVTTHRKQALMSFGIPPFSIVCL